MELFDPRCSTKRHSSLKAHFSLCLLLFLTVAATSSGEKWTRRLSSPKINSRTSHLLAKRSTAPITEGVPRCTDPGVPRNGIRVGEAFNVGSALRFACNPGFLLRGSEVLTCRYREPNTVEWDADVPQCVAQLPSVESAPPDPCGPPPEPSGFAFILSYQPGERVRYSCLGGYLPQLGSEELVCNEGEWQGQPLQCRRIGQCRDLGGIRNGRRVLEGTQENDTARFMCNEGYLLLGNHQVQCERDGSWTESWPQCVEVPVNCGDPGTLSHGRRFVSGTTEGSSAKFQCSHGYALLGESERVCQSSGEWSGQTPSCQRVNCSSPSPPRDGDVSYQGTKYGAQAAYSCHRGFVLSGAVEATCVSAGTWSDPPPSCTRVECGTPETPALGAVRYRDTLYGYTASYSCASGYGLVGNPVRTCRADGHWSGSTPSCNSDVCGTLSDPANGQVTVLSMTLAGVAVYSCDAGYQLSDPARAQRTCGLFEVWSGEAPTCEAITCPLLRPPLHASIATTNENFYDSVAEYTCSPGHVMIGGHGSIRRRCQANGLWTDRPSHCYRVKCEDLDAPHNALMVASGDGLGAEATYSCSDNYTLGFGDQIRTCTKTGRWSGIEPCCIRTKVFCKELSDPPTSTVVLTGVQAGDRAEYSCKEGLDLVGGDLTRICLSTGLWSGQEPICSVTCPQLSDPTNGSVTLEGNRPGDKAAYSCAPDFALMESDKCRVCQANGEWSGIPSKCTPIPSEPTACVNLSSPVNGRVSLSHGMGTGAIATYSCNEGYVLNGMPNRTCNVDGMWAGTAPTCQSVDCGPLTPPTNGAIDVNSTTLGSKVTFECDFGYDVTGASVRQCLSDGSWSGEDTLCQLVDCGDLDSPTNGIVALSGTTFGSEANYSCDSDYSLIGPDSRECMEDGVWSDVEPTCAALECSELVSPVNGLVEAPSRTVGSLATYSCNTGYSLLGSMETMCLASLTWNNRPPVCQLDLITCPTLPAIEGGLVEIMATTVGGKAVYRCNSGLSIRGSSTRTCGEDGEWTGEEPMCEVVECPVLPPLLNGVVIVNTLTALYVCNRGYVVDGLIVRFCGDDGAWVGEEPTCVRANCDTTELTDPENGRVTFSNATVGSTATYTCDIGYRLIGDSQRVCDVITGESLWSGDPPRCQKIVCPTLSNPINGRVFVTHNCFGGGALYGCDKGFQQSVGLLKRMCRENSQWDGEEPTCEPLPGTVVCPTLTDPLNGEIQIESTTANSSVSYTCNRGYQLDGLRTRECRNDGTWTGTEPVCTLIDCGTLENPSNGDVVTLGGTTLNQVARYFCDEGYNLAGLNFRVCLSTGVWSGSAPLCRLIDCGSLRSPVNGRVETPQGTTFGSEALYSCMDSYEINGASSRVCLQSGAWSRAAPTCSPIGTVPNSCGDPGTPVNGVRMLSATIVGSTVEYSCNQGYRLAGDDTRMCMEDLQWSGDLPTCDRVMCPLLADPENGQVFGNGRTVGSRVNYFCNRGYSIRRTDVILRECLLSGEWSGGEPMCIPNDSFQCEALRNIASGVVTVDSLNVGAVAEYSCEPGFELTGPSSRICLPVGVWSNFEPTCTRVQCEDIGTPLNGRVVMRDLTAGSRAYFVCNDGFQRQGSAVTQCMGNGTWSAPTPTCRAASNRAPSGTCSGVDSMLDSTGRLCQCVNGKLISCCRYRQDWASLSVEKRQLYIKAVKMVSSSPNFQPLYNELVRRYQDSFNTIAQHSMSDISQFFPWHRYFLLEYEDLLRMVNPSITIPYWDWSLISTRPFESIIFDPVNGFGNSADNVSMCVTSGPFREGEFVVTPSAGRTCLKREYTEFQFPSRSLIESDFLSLEADKFAQFHSSIQLFVNLNVRCYVGGHMCTPDAANDPLYILQLSRIDLILEQWQAMDEARANARYVNEDSPLFLTFDDSLLVSDFSSNSALPYGACVKYSPLQPDRETNTSTVVPSVGPDLPTIVSLQDPTSDQESEERRSVEMNKACPPALLSDTHLSPEEVKYLRDICGV